MIIDYLLTRLSCSAGTDLIFILRTRMVTASRAFRAAATKIWYSLLPMIRSTVSITSFQHLRESHLFNVAYNWLPPGFPSAPLTNCLNTASLSMVIWIMAPYKLTWLIHWLIDWLNDSENDPSLNFCIACILLHQRNVYFILSHLISSSLISSYLITTRKKIQNSWLTVSKGNKWKFWLLSTIYNQYLI